MAQNNLDYMRDERAVQRNWIEWIVRAAVVITAVDLLSMPVTLHVTAAATKSVGDGKLGPVLGAVAVHAVIAVLCTIIVFAVAIAQHIRRGTGLFWLPIQIAVVCGAALISYSLLILWPV